MAVELGWLDTNIFIHALSAPDSHYARCTDLINALQDGRAEGWINATVLHELSYVLSRRRDFAMRTTIATYLLEILNAPGVLAAEKAILIATVTRWGTTTIAFVDAYLTKLTQRDGLPVCTVNARDFPGIANAYATAVM